MRVCAFQAAALNGHLEDQWAVHPAWRQHNHEQTAARYQALRRQSEAHSLMVLRSILSKSSVHYGNEEEKVAVVVESCVPTRKRRSFDLS
jgi:hypothetical protein